MGARKGGKDGEFAHLLEFKYNVEIVFITFFKALVDV